ncbi:MAG: hypothetical protein ACRBFS_08570 [Aureispira sp.]
MKIISVKLEHSNPSMGPHERIITYSMSNQAAHETEFEQLLQNSTVNQAYSLMDFVKAYQEEDTALIKKITSIHAKERLPTGGTISEFSITLADGLLVKVSDLRVVHLGGYYQTFIPYLVKNGHRNEYTGGLGFGEPPLIKREELIPPKIAHIDSLAPEITVINKIDPLEEGNHLTDQ